MSSTISSTLGGSGREVKWVFFVDILDNTQQIIDDNLEPEAIANRKFHSNTANDCPHTNLHLLFYVHGSVFRRIDALLGEFRVGGGVHDSYTFQCGLVGSFTSPGIDTR